MAATTSTSSIEILQEIIATINKNASTCENILGRDNHDLSRSFSFIDIDKFFTNEEPAVEEPAAEEPAAEEPAAEEPAAEEPAAEEPAAEEPAAEEPAIEESTHGFDKEFYESLKPKLESLIAEGYSFRNIWNGLLVLADEKKI